MKARFKASKKTISHLNEKSKYAMMIGDVVMMRKILVIELISQGFTFNKISIIAKVSLETIRSWFVKFLIFGIKFLLTKKPSGRPSKLSKSQIKNLCKIIDNGPIAAGFSSGCWSSAMIQKVIFDNFNVMYSCYYIAELLKNIGYSYQKAKFISAGRNENNRKVWLEKIWPQIIEESHSKNSYLLFGDECSFSQFGSLSYSWSKKGVQPTVISSGSKKSYKVFGLVDYFTGKLFSMATEGQLNQDSYIAFLQYVLSMTKKHVIIIQDGASYHTSDEVDQFISENVSRMTVYTLPACSPDYNPIEMLWKKMKKAGTHMKYFPDFNSLVEQVENIMSNFTLSRKEILSLFGLYDKQIILSGLEKFVKRRFF